jgi:hypothetical protein
MALRKDNLKSRDYNEFSYSYKDIKFHLQHISLQDYLMSENL